MKEFSNAEKIRRMRRARAEGRQLPVEPADDPEEESLDNDKDEPEEKPEESEE
jgi:hypothetical protein